eukprot:TRINITY_DN9946_c0_g3_i3.p1 TRINITY_DN9946_c0_g3~~TRINITY_DN9946_c0_g3_i3.p1  ORF type:complete len:1146 (+),score=170.52 TRINITY_DN9946_c0_g3_i3:41-3478(+)
MPYHDQMEHMSSSSGDSDKVGMEESQLSKLVQAVKRELRDRTVCILGGDALDGADTEQLVGSIARELAVSMNGTPTSFVIRGDVDGERIAFAEQFGNSQQLCSLMPEGQASTFNMGKEINVGSDVVERNKVFEHLGDVYIIFEGGSDEARMAREIVLRGGRIVPLMRTGGASSGMFDFPASALQTPRSADAEQWNLLKHKGASIADCSAAVVALVENIVADAKREGSGGDESYTDVSDDRESSHVTEDQYEQDHYDEDEDQGDEDQGGSANQLRVESDAAADEMDSVNLASIELAAMVRPADGTPTSPQEIWDRVVEDNVRLPGSNWDTTVEGAMDAARQGDWALCAYLAARCFVDGGVSGAATLAAPDERCQKTLWLEMAAPIVVEVPAGMERFSVRLDGCEQAEWIPVSQLGIVDWAQGRVRVRGRGHGILSRGANGSAEHFNRGQLVELSGMQWRRAKLKQIVLLDEERLDLRQTLDCGGRPGLIKSAIGSATSLRCVSGSWFHVLEYPLVQDFTKVLLRPSEPCWTKLQRGAAEGAVRWLGETLISQCAKAGQWDLVEMFLKARVPCPDLMREFQDVCGQSPVVRRQWLRDLTTAAGQHRLSLLEIAAEDQGGLDRLRRVLIAMQSACQGPIDLRGRLGPGRPSLIEAAARRRRWDVVMLLLDEAPNYGAIVSGAPLLGLQAKPPPEILQLLKRGRQVAAPLQAENLRSYFLRLHAGEIMGGEAPGSFNNQQGVLVNPRGTRVLNNILHLGCVAGDPKGELVFVGVSPDELETARRASLDSSYAMLPVSLTRRSASSADFPPEDSMRNGDGNLAAWFPVLCSPAYLLKSSVDRKGSLVLKVPMNQISTPYIVRSTCVRVLAETPCCGTPLQGVAIFASGRRVGVTGADGILELSLPPGKHSVSAPAHSQEEKLVEVKQRESSIDDVRLSAGDIVFMYLNDLSYDECSKDGVFICTNREHPDLPDELKPYSGGASVSDPSWESKAVICCAGKPSPVLSVGSGTRCANVLSSIQVKTDDGRQFDPNEDAEGWFETFQDDCQIAMLFEMSGLRLGNLLGSPGETTGVGAAAAAATAVAAAAPAAAPAAAAACAFAASVAATAAAVSARASAASAASLPVSTASARPSASASVSASVSASASASP